MQRFVIGTAVAALAAGAASGNLVGVASFGDGAQGLFSIDAATGAATLIGNTGVRNIVGIEWDDNLDRLLAYTSTSDLYALNAATGEATPVGEAFGFTPEGGLAISGSTLYAARPGVLGTVDRTTGAFTDTGIDLDATSDLSGLAISGTTLYGYASSVNGGAAALVSVDVGSENFNVIGNTGFTQSGNVGGLDFDAAGSLYLSSGDSLYTVDTATGAASLIGSHGVSGFSGITFIPAPGTGVLLGLAALAARRRR